MSGFREQYLMYSLKSSFIFFYEFTVSNLKKLILT